MTLRVGIVGLVHDHVWSLIRDWEAVADAEIVAVAESDAALWRKVRTRRSHPEFLASWRDMLRLPLDAVMITTPNNLALPVVREAAARDLSIMLEKPLAASLAEAEQIFELAAAGKGVFFVNWFTHWNPAIRTALELAKRGEIGRIQYFRFRIGHAGPREIGCTPEFCSWLYDPAQNGGGALVDFCGYGACMAAFLLGAPEGVYGLSGRYVKTDIVAEDNGLLALRYGEAMAVCEGSWTQLSPTQIDGPIMHGEFGSIVVADGEVRRFRSLSGGYEVVPPLALSEHERSGPAYFAHCVAAGRRPDGLFDPLNSLVAQRCLDAGLRASAGSAEVALRISQ